MSNLAGSFVLTTTGSNIAISGVGFEPNDLEFSVGAKSNESGAMQICRGYVDSAGNQFVLDDTGDQSDHMISVANNTHCILVREWNSGTSSYQNVLLADFSSFTSDGFRLNVTIANSNYTIFVKARQI